jgi:hypothetical protein
MSRLFHPTYGENTIESAVILLSQEADVTFPDLIGRQIPHNCFTVTVPLFLLLQLTLTTHTNSMLHIMTSTPDYYQPKSHLSVRTDHGDLLLEVIHVFVPFTFSQVLLVRTDHGAPSLNLPAAFLLILKVYDPRFTLKERTKSPLHPELPWTFEAEAEAARIRQPLPWFDEGGYPHRVFGAK